MVGAERGEVDETMEECIGSGGDGITIHGPQEFQWANYIPGRQDFESVEDVVYRGLEGESTIDIRSCQPPSQQKDIPFVRD